MKAIIYILVFFTLAAKSQTVLEPCGMTLRDTLVTQYVDFGSCNLLIMADASYLKVEYLQGSGDIRYTNPESTIPIIEFTTCYPYESGNVYIDDSIIIIQPEGCESLTIEEVNPNDREHLKPLLCVVYNTIGQKIYEGKYGAVRFPTIGIYYVRFEYFSIKELVTKND